VIHKREDIILVHDREKGEALCTRLRGRSPLFVCTIAYTQTVQIPGISAAGTTPENRELTAAADAEVLHCGKALCLEGVPSNPSGAPGPVIITKASLEDAGIEHLIVDAGMKRAPRIDCIRLPSASPALCVTSGCALPKAPELFEEGLALGEELAGRGDYLVLAESVPGGTTTALALLWALGYDAQYRVSSSMPGNPHPIKIDSSRQGLEKAGLLGHACTDDPLRGAAAVGDPMQPAVAGMALALLKKSVPVILGGGTQMMAVLALMKAMAGAKGWSVPWDILAVATTCWVSEDSAADLAGLAREIGVSPVLASGLDFGRSRYPEMRLYEQGYVKEGVGAGGAAVAAMLKTGIPAEELLRKIEPSSRGSSCIPGSRRGRRETALLSEPRAARGQEFSPPITKSGIWYYSFLSPISGP